MHCGMKIIFTLSILPFALILKMHSRESDNSDYFTLRYTQRSPKTTLITSNVRHRCADEISLQVIRANFLWQCTVSWKCPLLCLVSFFLLFLFFNRHSKPEEKGQYTVNLLVNQLAILPLLKEMKLKKNMQQAATEYKCRRRQEAYTLNLAFLIHRNAPVAILHKLKLMLDKNAQLCLMAGGLCLSFVVKFGWIVMLV